MSDLAIAVDIGGTRTRTALVDRRGRILARASIATLPLLGPDDGIKRIAAAVQQVAGGAPVVLLAGIGIGMPGLVDARRNLALTPANLPGWDQAPVAARLSSAFHLRAWVANDANAAALAENRYGAGRGEDDMVYLTISTGIGGGIIAGGRLLTGADGFAGEIGHTTIDADGPPCPCGNTGCLEVIAAGPAIARRARAALHAGEPSLMRDLAQGNIESVDGEIISQAARLGDALALRIIEQAGTYIGAAMVSLVHLLNPRLFVLGGGVTNMGEPLFAAIRRTVDQRTFAASRSRVRIEPAVLGDDAGLLGAAALVFSVDVAGSPY